MTVTRKIVLSILTILALGALSMTIIFYGLQKLGDAIHRLANSKQPSSAAAYEMEINILGIATGTLSYLNHPQKDLLDGIRKDEQDFERFHSQYSTLAETHKEKELAKAVDQAYEEFKKLSQMLIQEKESQIVLLNRLAQNFDSMDRILDEKIEVGLDHRKPDELIKMTIAVDMETDLAELLSALGSYRETKLPEDRNRISEQETEFRRVLMSFMKLNLTRSERESVDSLQKIFDETMKTVNEILVLEAYFQEQMPGFLSLRASIDELLDEEIQVLTQRELDQPRKDADRIATWVVRMMLITIPLFLLSAGFIGYMLVRGIRNPVKKLVQGTNEIGKGDLAYRIDLPGRDEFANLATQFNFMVDQLEATTVSKTRLEASEAKLREAVDELRKEILDRERAEKEQVRLQAELHRSEIMAAMGTLVAGVAHEARNPLFGVSSIIDALEARLGEAGIAEKYAQHLRLLREQITRLTKLMKDLLEYGKPSNLEFSPGSIDLVVKEAIQICEPAANQHHIKLMSEFRSDQASVRMDKARLVEAFKNLIENAVQHSSSGQVVKIEVSKLEQNGMKGIECAIKDSGPGFAEQDISKVFEPFFSKRSNGTGLGLSIVQRTIERHHGEVIVGNRREGGAVVTVRLPLNA